MPEQPEKIILRRAVSSRIRLGFLKSLIFVPLRAVAAFKGVIVAAAIIAAVYLAASNLGAPGIHYAYDYRGTFGQQRYKTACRYLSPYGIHERSATRGRCSWVILVKGETS